MQSVIDILFSQNFLISKLMLFPLSIIEIITYYYFMTFVAAATKIDLKTTYLNSILAILLSFACAALIPLPFVTIFLILIYILFTHITFKASIFKSTIYVFIYLLLSVFFEQLIDIFIMSNLNLDVLTISAIPIYKLCFSSITHLLIIVVIFFLKTAKLSLKLLDNMSKKDKIYLTINLLILTLIPIINLALLIFKVANNTQYYIFYNTFSSLIFLVISFYIITKINNIHEAKQQLYYLELYNSTLSTLVDLNKQFKHDINNIIFAISGYISLNDMQGLHNYYKNGLLPEIDKINELSEFNNISINSPSVFGLLMTKYNLSLNKNIHFTITSFIDYSTINLEEYTLTKILGILIDNAMEATSLCDKKEIKYSASIDFVQKFHFFEISNTCIDNNIDISKIFQKNFSTKTTNSGIGLYEVANLLKTHPQLSVETEVKNNLFTQKIYIKF